MNFDSIGFVFDADGVAVRSQPFTTHLEESYGIPRLAMAPFIKQSFKDFLLAALSCKSAAFSLVRIRYSDRKSAPQNEWSCS